MCSMPTAVPRGGRKGCFWSLILSSCPTEASQRKRPFSGIECQVYATRVAQLFVHLSPYTLAEEDVSNLFRASAKDRAIATPPKRDPLLCESYSVRKQTKQTQACMYHHRALAKLVNRLNP